MTSAGSPGILTRALGEVLGLRAVLASALVDLDSAFVLDAWTNPAARLDVENVAAAQAEVLRAAAELGRALPTFGTPGEIVLHHGISLFHMVKPVPDPVSGGLALVLVIAAPERNLRRVRRRLARVPMDSLVPPRPRSAATAPAPALAEAAPVPAEAAPVPGEAPAVPGAAAPAAPIAEAGLPEPEGRTQPGQWSDGAAPAGQGPGELGRADGAPSAPAVTSALAVFRAPGPAPAPAAAPTPGGQLAARGILPRESVCPGQGVPAGLSASGAQAVAPGRPVLPGRAVPPAGAGAPQVPMAQMAHVRPGSGSGELAASARSMGAPPSHPAGAQGQPAPAPGASAWSARPDPVLPGEPMAPAQVRPAPGSDDPAPPTRSAAASRGQATPPAQGGRAPGPGGPASPAQPVPRPSTRPAAVPPGRPAPEPGVPGTQDGPTVVLGPLETLDRSRPRGWPVSAWGARDDESVAEAWRSAEIDWWTPASPPEG